jgi:hypothetical protein
VAQGIKGVRPRASKALKDLAAAMVSVGQVEGSEAKQRAFVEECKDLQEFTQVGFLQWLANWILIPQTSVDLSDLP